MSEKNLNGLSRELREIDRTFKEQIEPYRSDLWRYCYKLTGSPWDAEDLVQETLLKSLSMLAKVFQPLNTKAYLFKIASNTWIDQTRKKKIFQESMENSVVPDPNSADQLQVMESLDILIRRLTPTQYVTLILSDVFLYTGKEIAEIIGSGEGAVHTNLSRARKIMKEQQVDVHREAQSGYKAAAPSNQVIETLLEGFRKKDPDLIATLLDENMVTDIVHSGYEIGLDETKKNSLKDWQKVALGQHEIVTEYVELWGQRVVIELERKTDGKLYLTNVHRMELIEGKITYWKFYCFSWDLMKMVAEELDVQMNAEYFYHIF